MIIFNKEKIEGHVRGGTCSYNHIVYDFSFEEDDDSIYVEFKSDDSRVKDVVGYEPVGKMTVSFTIDADGEIIGYNIIEYKYSNLDEIYEEEDIYEDYESIDEWIKEGICGVDAEHFFDVIGCVDAYYKGFKDCVIDVSELCETFSSESDNNIVIHSHRWEYGENDATLEFEIYINDDMLDDAFIVYDLYSEEYSITVNNKEYAKGNNAKSLFTNFYNKLNKYSLYELYKKYPKEVVGLYTVVRDFIGKQQADSVKDILLEAIDNGKINQEDKDDLDIEREDNVIRAIWETMADQDFISDKQQKYVELAKRSISD